MRVAASSSRAATSVSIEPGRRRSRSMALRSPFGSRRRQTPSAAYRRSAAISWRSSAPTAPTLKTASGPFVAASPCDVVVRTARMGRPTGRSAATGHLRGRGGRQPCRAWLPKRRTNLRSEGWRHLDHQADSRLALCGQDRTRGSKASRRPSAIRKTLRTVSRIIRPGIHQPRGATERVLRATEHVAPTRERDRKCRTRGSSGPTPRGSPTPRRTLPQR